MPPEGPVTVRVAGWGIGGLLVKVIPVPLPGTEAFERGLDLEWLRARTVTARLVGPDGSPAKGWIELCRYPGTECLSRESLEERGPPAAEPEMTVRSLGKTDVFVVPEDPALATHRRSIRIREDSPERIDLGDIHLAAAPRVPLLRLLVRSWPAQLLPALQVVLS